MIIACSSEICKDCNNPKNPLKELEKAKNMENNLECFDSDAFRWRQASIKSINQ
jgi:hypothetical protein